MGPAGNLDRFPNGWIDPLELYGEHLHEIKAFGCILETERNTLIGLIEKFGGTWVWWNRPRLVSIAKALKDYPRK